MHLEGDDIGDEAWKVLKCQGKLKNIENLGAQIRLISSTLNELLQSYTEKPNKIDPHLTEFLTSVYTEPSWLDWNLIQQGQQLFKRYEVSALLGLLCYSLVGGFTSPRIVGVLYLSSDLSKSRDKVFRRLLETLEMVFSCMESPESLKPGIMNKGWVHSLRTRLIHSCVRVQLTSKSTWDKSKAGVPINQEDLISTLFTFSFNILKIMRFLGAPIQPEDEYAYLHTWRYIGYLIGISEKNNPCTSINNMLLVFTERIIPNISLADQSQSASGILARQVLEAASFRYPLNISYKLHSEYSRAFLGSDYANALGIEHSMYHRFIVWFSIFWLRFFNYFFVCRLDINSPTFQRMCSKHRYFLNYHLATPLREDDNDKNMKVE